MKQRKIIFRGQVINLAVGEDNLWRDSEGTVYGFTDDNLSVDKVTRCGIGPLSLPKESELNKLCAGHDYMYSSPAYQAFNTREAADNELERQFAQANYPLVGKVFRLFSRLLGAAYWENKHTNK